METTKLTIRVPRQLLEGAKQYAKEHNTNITRLLVEYLRQLSAEDELLKDAPIVRRLSGSLSQDISVQDYRTYLDTKYDTQA